MFASRAGEGSLAQERESLLHHRKKPHGGFQAIIRHQVFCLLVEVIASPWTDNDV
jgi:hypothetical protein